MSRSSFVEQALTRLPHPDAIAAMEIAMTPATGNISDVPAETLKKYGSYVHAVHELAAQCGLRPGPAANVYELIDQLLQRLHDLNPRQFFASSFVQRDLVSTRPSDVIFKLYHNAKVQADFRQLQQHRRDAGYRGPVIPDRGQLAAQRYQHDQKQREKQAVRDRRSAVQLACSGVIGRRSRSGQVSDSQPVYDGAAPFASLP